MKPVRIRLCSVAALILLLCASACVTPRPTLTPVPISRTFTVASPTVSLSGQLSVFAASSLTDAFLEIGKNFQMEHPGTTVLFTFAAPGQLVSLIQQSRPADVYAPSSPESFNEIASTGGIDGEGAEFGEDRLVVVAPNGSGKVKSLGDLAVPGISLILAGPLDPLRGQTMALLDNLTRSADYGSDFKANALKNATSQEDNARRVIEKILGGGVDAGVVYVTDVTEPDISAKVFQILIPDELNVKTSYMIGVLKESTNKDLAQVFIDYVMSQPGQDVLRKWAFLPPASN